MEEEGGLCDMVSDVVIKHSDKNNIREIKQVQKRYPWPDGSLELNAVLNFYRYICSSQCSLTF